MTQHPQLHLVDAVCSACGTTYALRSTVDSLSVDVCANCHPAYTGARQSVVTGDRIDRFNRRRALAAA
jgi:large subunit ribosomal protein L31